MTVGVWFLGLASVLWGQEPDISTFRTEYLQAAKKLEQAYDHCYAKVEQVVTDDKTDYLGKAFYTFVFDGDKLKFDRTLENRVEGKTNKWSRSVIGTKDISFVLLTRDNRTLVEQVDRSAKGYDDAAHSINAQADSVRAAFSFLGQRLSARLASPSFKIDSVASDGEAIKLACSDREKGGRRYKGWVLLLPKRQWVIDSWDMNVTTVNPEPYTWRYAVKVHYGSDDPVPRVDRIEKLAYHPDRTDTEKLTISQLDFGRVAASEFMLSHYGYDDRIGLRPAAFGVLWLWLGAGGVACLLVAFALRRMAAKRATA